MTDDKDHKDEQESKEEESEEKDDKVEKSLDALADVIKGFDINGLRDDISYVGETLDKFESRLKALEEPTDLPLKPKVSAEDDIGAKVKTPDEYQSNSQQAGIKEADPENSTGDDKSNLSMQEKSVSQQNYAFTTETPRPNASLDTIEKSSGIELNPVLKASREVGAEGLSSIGKRILSGEFGQPGEGEVPQW
jgi:hypothetical protein